MTRHLYAASVPTPALPGKRGFTIPELACVCLLIGVLAFLLLPVFAKATDASRRSVCASNLEQLGMALHLYATDNDGHFPARHNDFQPLVGSYLRNPDVLWCLKDAVWPADRSGKSLHRLAGWTYSSYQYRGGLTLEDRWDIPVAGDWDFVHDSGANSLTLSGSVKLRKAGAWIPIGPGPRPLPPGVSPNPAVSATPYVSIRNGKAGAVIAPIFKPAEPSAQEIVP